MSKVQVAKNAAETINVPESQATTTTRAQLVEAKALTSVVDDALENINPLPVDFAELPVEVAAVLGPDERELWATVEQRGRERLLERALRRRISSAERRLAQLQRQDLCAYYIDTLCRMSENRRSEIGEEAYAELRREFVAAKAAWESLRGKSSRPVSRARAIPKEVNEELADLHTL